MFKKNIPVALLTLLVSGCSDREEAEVTGQVEDVEVEEKQSVEETDSEGKGVDLTVIDQLLAINKELKSTKEKEGDDEYERIHQNIDAWVKEIEKIRSEQ
ncbi:hypothetical protein KD050_12715 [Psychrobacillus sp. INOP01]|uniref:hypothetical protein n=1 Tax=Psychrobacillus sp. INOP01 TaxID=2829187 RepID=UPI001BAE2AEA|nr:hypothetical protein [Psychrobacillus sp. INOP01]QUG40173.1 hypothetical protein KD050_12715 [Psychrobacillus sp. INOP01]